MPKFCRHNRLIQNCPICSREEAVELRPLVSSSTPRVSEPRARTPRTPSPAGRERSRASMARSGVTVRRVRESSDDGYRNNLVPGLRSSEEAQRLAEEIAFAATRLRVLASDPPGLYAAVANQGNGIEERTWLAFLIAYLYPLERPDPFAAIAAARKSWADANELELEGVETGPRSAHERARGLETVNAYRAWVARSGSQAEAFGGEAGWSSDRRFARIFERLALPGMNRDARFELLTSLGALGLYELAPASLALGGTDHVTLAAKRALAIGETQILERRAAALAEACSVPLAALDHAFYSWERGERATAGMGPDAAPGTQELDAAMSALGL